jgi:Fe-S oxidoreductase
MCPSYRGTLDERHSTRGRGNALRLAISGQFGNASNGPDWNDPDTMHTLDLCLACKACKSECPSNVDIARLKAEYLAQSYKAAGKTPLKAKVFGHVRTLNRLGSILPGVSNFVGSLEFVRSIMNRVLKLAPQRTLPKYERSLYTWFASRDLVGTRPAQKVVLYADCFATYNEPHIGKAAVAVLEALGYDVLLPKVGCCGRAMMSTGILADACRSADRTLADLKTYIDDDSVKAIVVCEPSCLASFKDDWLSLNIATPIATRKKLAGKSWLVEEFVDRFWDAHPKKPTPKKLAEPVVLHGHCHQKALWGDQTSSALLKRLAEQVTVLPSGCCGMAGSFGYDVSKYELSMKIGELSVFPPVRQAPADAVICAPGTSCRHQIHDGTKRQAIHPIELAARVLAK